MKLTSHLSMLLVAAIAAGAGLTTSCVSKSKYTDLQSRYDSLQASYAESQESLGASASRAQTLDQLLAEARARNEELRKDYDQVQHTPQPGSRPKLAGNANISKLVDEINASNRYIQQLVAAKSRSDSLNLVLTSNLTRSLSGPELKDVDVKVLKGVVYISLADNMLFKSGSYNINPQAMDILGKIAKIIKDYKDYSVLVEGNTDNVPISKTNIRNNWDLSALRASSVVQALQDKFGVDPSRLSPPVAVANTILLRATVMPRGVSSTGAPRS